MLAVWNAQENYHPSEPQTECGVCGALFGPTVKCQVPTIIIILTFAHRHWNKNPQLKLNPSGFVTSIQRFLNAINSSSDRLASEIFFLLNQGNQYSILISIWRTTYGFVALIHRNARYWEVLVYLVDCDAIRFRDVCVCRMYDECRNNAVRKVDTLSIATSDSKLVYFNGSRF